jgi:uncharacterized protein (UPF0147 family)
MNNYVTKSNNMWTGVVEDTLDPLNLGRCRVRVFGVHSENLAEVPTKTLPWAMPIASPNTGKTFSTLVEGDYVVGYFQDGDAAQSPVVIGLLPGVIIKSQNSSKGFSPQSTEPIKKDLPAGQSAGPVTTPPLARSVVANTAIASTNASLQHACDFRYELNLDIGLGGLENPVTAIQNAIKSGKNKAAQAIRILVEIMNDKFRLVVDAILKVIGLDPTGKVSLEFTIAKDLFREINKITKRVAKAVELASFYVSLFREIQQIVEYLNSLPDRIKSIVQQCILNFLGSVQNFVSQVQAVPGQIQGTAETMLTQLSNTTKETMSSVQSTSADPTMYALVSGTDANGSFSLTTYMAGITSAAQQISSDGTSNSYDKQNTQSP